MHCHGNLEVLLLHWSVFFFFCTLDEILLLYTVKIQTVPSSYTTEILLDLLLFLNALLYVAVDKIIW